MTGTSEAFVRYVVAMYEVAEEYGHTPAQISNELEASEAKTTKKMKEIYGSLYGGSICTTCKNTKMYDESNDEYYCPVHG